MKEDFFKIFLAGICGILASFFHTYGLILSLVCVAIVFDCTTGIIRAVLKGQGLTSKKAQIGFLKKITLLVGLFFGIFLDWFIPFALSYISFTVNFTMPFALIIGCYIILNESISICENLYESNPNLMPKSICKLLTIAKKKLDDETNIDTVSNIQPNINNSFDSVNKSNENKKE